MAIQRPIDSQARARELGIVRIGEKKPTQNGGTRPAMRETFRITSPQRAILEAVQAVYGGELRPWAKTATEKEWELLTTVNELRVFIVPDRCMSEHMEQWSRGGCTHRCDTVTVQMSQDGQPVTRPCVCDPQNPACKLATRLQFGLSNVPLLGIWRLTSGGKIFSSEMRAELDQMSAVGMGSQPIYCILSVRQQEIRKNGKVSKFAVPGITIDPSPPDFPALLQGMTISGRLEMQRQSAAQIEAPTAPQTRQIEAPAAVPQARAAAPEVDDDDDAVEADYRDEGGGTLQPVKSAAPAQQSAQAQAPVQAELLPRPVASLTQENVLFHTPKSGWIQCDDCGFTIAQIPFANGQSACYNADGRRHETTCGAKKPSGWDEYFEQREGRK